jgi:hypothetical protein
MSDDRHAWQQVNTPTWDGGVYVWFVPVAEAFWHHEQDIALTECFKIARRGLTSQYPHLSDLRLICWRMQPPPIVQIEDEPPRNMILIEVRFEGVLPPGK